MQLIDARTWAVARPSGRAVFSSILFPLLSPGIHLKRSPVLSGSLGYQQKRTGRPAPTRWVSAQTRSAGNTRLSLARKARTAPYAHLQEVTQNTIAIAPLASNTHSCRSRPSASRQQLHARLYISSRYISNKHIIPKKVICVKGAVRETRAFYQRVRGHGRLVHYSRDELNKAGL
jgi:hypothetical protein